MPLGAQRLNRIRPATRLTPAGLRMTTQMAPVDSSREYT